MASLIKKQILKHLSKFTKNLSTDNFNFSTLKGEGELTDLQLDEIVLTDLLELPGWLRLSHALCNRVCFRIQWAKLKSVPIQLMLDEVIIEVETCEEIRTMTSSNFGLSSYSGAAKYSFIHKVIDGMTVTVNTVKVHFRSPAFTSSVELSRITVKSKSPKWKDAELPETRLKDSTKGYVLLFKELVWQNVRIEAKSTEDLDLTPLRLITNQAVCRITLKKRISDSLIMGSRLLITLDDLLWVLTDYQLRAAFHFLDSLAGLIKKVTELTRKKKAARKLQELPEYQEAARSQLSREQNTEQSLNKKQVNERFLKVDVIETSYHFIAHRIDLHISDDNKEGRSIHPELQQGGSLQITLSCFQVDFYPYHLASAGRSHWPMYRETSSGHSEWLKNAQNQFFQTLGAFTDSYCLPSSNGLSSEMIKTFVRKQLSTLMTSCFILRMSNFNISQVNVSGGKNQTPRDFISGDKEQYNLPENCSLVHAEFTYYYYPDDDPFPAPIPKFCVHLEPIQMCFDVKTVLWLNAFALALQQSLSQTSSGDAVVSSLMTFDVHIVAIQFRIMFESLEERLGQKDRPKILQFQVSRTSITNVRHYETGFKTELQSSVNIIQLASLFFRQSFPSDSKDLLFSVEKFSKQLQGCNIEVEPCEINSANQLRDLINRGLNKAEAKELWCIHLDPLSGVFLGAKAVGKDLPVAFLDNLPITLWMELKLLPNPNIHVIANVGSLVSVQLNRYQYLFLLQLDEKIKELSSYLAVDTTRILKKPSDLVLVAGTVIPQIELTVLMPPLTPGKSSSGGDMESFIPDSSSLQDENWQSSSSAVNEKPKPVNGRKLGEADISKTANGTFAPPKLPRPINTEVHKESRKLSTGHISFINEEVAAGLKKAWKDVSSIMTSLDIHPNAQSPDEISSVKSMKSDLSSESETCSMMHLDDPYENMFDGRPTVIEEAAECLEDENNTNTLTSPSERDSFNSSFKRHDLVSTCTFKLRKVEAQIQLLGSSSLVKAQVNNLTAGECSSISWDEFQSKFNSRHRGWVEGLLPETSINPQVRLRLNRELSIEYPVPNKIPDPVVDLEVQVQSLRLDMALSSVTGLIELLEDEVRPSPLPAKILLEDIKLHLVDDRPVAEINAMEPIPVDVVVKKLLINRDATGVIEIPDPSEYSGEIKSNQDNSALKKLQMENEELRRRLTTLDRLAEENYQLRRYQEETEALRPSFTDIQNRVSSLLEDKQKLLDNIKCLQDQLVSSNRFTKR